MEGEEADFHPAGGRGCECPGGNRVFENSGRIYLQSELCKQRCGCWEPAAQYPGMLLPPSSRGQVLCQRQTEIDGLLWSQRICPADSELSTSQGRNSLPSLSFCPPTRVPYRPRPGHLCTQHSLHHEAQRRCPGKGKGKRAGTVVL